MTKTFWQYLVEEDASRPMNSTWSECVLSVSQKYPETLNDYENGLLPLHFMLLNLKTESSMKTIEALLTLGTDITKPVLHPKYEYSNTFEFVQNLLNNEKNDGTSIAKTRIKSFEKMLTLLEKHLLEKSTPVSVQEVIKTRAKI